VSGAEGAWTLWHYHHAGGRGLVRLARRRPYRTDPPKPGSGPRRIWSDSKGVLRVSLWGAGGIGRYDPAAKNWKVYRMPNSTTGTYSVFVDDKDRVWATDWPANAIQRFNPKTETYETFVSNKSGASVRQMLGRPGEAWAAESGTNRLAVIRD